jgi:calcium-dependent protein kinase
MITDTNEVILIDFGLSMIKPKKNMIHEVAGTTYYMAPEVIIGNYNEKADLWSLGVLLYTLVCGYMPF